MSLTVWGEQVRQFLAEKDLSPRTKASYKAALRQFGEWWEAECGSGDDDGETLDIETVPLRDVVDWREHLQRQRGDRQPAKAATVNCKVAAVRALAAHFERQLAVKRVEQQYNARQALSVENVAKLRRALRGETWLAARNRAAVALMLYAGLRVSEVVALTVEDLHLRERSGYVLVRRGKGNKEREVVVPPEARREVREYLEVRPAPIKGVMALFLSQRGTALSARELQRVVRDAGVRAKITEVVTPHRLRHTYATLFVRVNGEGSLAALQEVLGHSSPATTMRYLHSTREEQQAMADRAAAEL